MDGHILRCGIISSCQSACKARLVLSLCHARSAIASAGLYLLLLRCRVGRRQAVFGGRSTVHQRCSVLRLNDGGRRSLRRPHRGWYADAARPRLLVRAHTADRSPVLPRLPHCHDVRLRTQQPRFRRCVEICPACPSNNIRGKLGTFGGGDWGLDQCVV